MRRAATTAWCLAVASLRRSRLVDLPNLIFLLLLPVLPTPPFASPEVDTPKIPHYNQPFPTSLPAPILQQPFPTNPSSTNPAPQPHSHPPLQIVTSTLATKLSRPVEGGPVQVTLSPRGDSGGPSTRDFDVVFWTAGSVPASSPADRFSAPPPARFPFATDARGATETDAMLRVRHSRRAFAIGDIATAGAARLPATAQVAFQQADYAAWNLWASINGRPLLPFRRVKKHLGSMSRSRSRLAWLPLSKKTSPDNASLNRAFG